MGINRTSCKLIMLFTSVTIFACLICFSNAEINVKIQRHFPCSAKSGPKQDNLRIRFPRNNSSKIVFDETRKENKCFSMSGGTVEVFSPGLDGSKKYYVHLETRIGIHNKPERCFKPDKEGCGGIGSCIHCDICRTLGGNLRNFVQIYKNEKPAQCDSQGLPSGQYNDLSLKVCLPNKEELLPFLDPNTNRAQEIWNLFANSRGASNGEIPLVIGARIFDRPINKLSKAELNDALHVSKEGMIGCHWIYLTISQN